MAEDKSVFLIDEALTLNKEARAFLRSINVRVEEYDEMHSMNANNTESKPECDLIDLFRICSAEDSFMLSQLLKDSKPEDCIRFFDEKTIKLQDDICLILDSNESGDIDDTFDTIEMIRKQVDRYIQSHKVRTSQYVKSLDSTLREKKQPSSMYDFLREEIKKFIIEIIPGLYRGLRHNRHDLYMMTLRDVNLFLKSLGIETIDIKVEEKINFENCDALEDFIVTNNYKLDHSILEISQLPYQFSNKEFPYRLIVHGKASIRRLEG